MSNLQKAEKLIKNGLYRSHHEISIPSTSASVPLNMSVISLGSQKNQQHRQNGILYKYERVGNMFKLVDVRQKRANTSQISQTSVGAQAKNNPKLDPVSLSRISETVQDLINRVISLELQQAKFPSFERKLAETSDVLRGVELQADYLSERLRGFAAEMHEVDKRLEDIEEQEACYEREFSDIVKLVGDIRMDLVAPVKQFDQLKDELVQEFKEYANKQIQQLKENLIKFTTSEKSQIPPPLTPLTQLPQPQKQTTTSSTNLATPISLLNLFNSSPIQSLSDNQTDSIQEGNCISDVIEYQVDGDGILMDARGFVIVDANDREFFITQAQLQKLRDFGILKF